MAYKPINHKKVVGNKGENIAAEYLIASGYRILARNFRTWFGEIDIVCEKNGVIHVVEVKTQSAGSSVQAFENAHYRKMTKVAKMAEYYATVVDKRRLPFTVDLVVIVLSEDGKGSKSINFFENIEL